MQIEDIFTFSLLFSEYVDLTCYIIMWCLVWFSIGLCAALQLIHWLLSWCIVTDAVVLWVNYTPIIQKHCGVLYTCSIQAIQCPILLLSLETIAIIQSSTLKPGDDMSELNWSLYVSPGEWKKEMFLHLHMPNGIAHCHNVKFQKVQFFYATVEFPQGSDDATVEFPRCIRCHEIYAEWW